MALTNDQAKALEKIQAFLANQTQTAFLLSGSAGTGKTWLLGEILKSATGIRACCAPTHKATQVLRRKLQAFGIQVCYGYNASTYDRRDVITATTAALLGIRPCISDDQTEDDVQFKKLNDGLLGKVKPNLLIIDEISMVSMRDALRLMNIAKAAGVKLIFSGDAGQLPPVKEIKIPFEQFRTNAVLKEIVRQEQDSAIIKIASAIREGKPWQKITGPGVEHTRDLVKTFLDRVKASTDPEESRSVLLAYRNKKVDYVQERVCQKLYKHGHDTIRAGELVLSEMNFYDTYMDVNARGFPVLVKELMAANLDELVVEEFHDEKPDPTLGIRVSMRHLVRNERFEACYLPGTALADPKHPYNIELRSRLDRAKELQEKYKQLQSQKRYTESEGVNDLRRDAWSFYFEFKDQTVLRLRHPFSLTTHRSQGSTYSTAFVDADDILRFSSSGLYVAVSRPKDLLVLEDKSATIRSTPTQPKLTPKPYAVDLNDPLLQ